MTTHALENERLHLASLLEAIQRCVYFLAASDHRHTLIPTLYGNANRFLNYCATALEMSPSPGHFVDDFALVMNSLATNQIRI